MTDKTIADVLEFAPRAEELATRLVAAGPKAAHVSASETHEIADFVHMAIAVLSKLRAPVSSIREGFELTYAADADDPACASDLSHFTNGWRTCLMSQVRAPVAVEQHDGLRTLLAELPCMHEDPKKGDAVFRCGVNGALNVVERRIRELLRSAPVAGEAVYTLRVRGVIRAWTPTAAAFSIPDGEHQL
ncbi:hypothetical protein ACOTC4_32685, partial [Achromobacter xylosoxidans]